MSIQISYLFAGEQEKIARRLMDKSKTVGCCRVWTKATDGHGYGVLNVRPFGVQKAHRLSYMAHKGDIPKGMMVCHTCDNRACINPFHLFLGTAKDNAHDAIKKGRMEHIHRPRFGETNSNCKLSAVALDRVKENLKRGIPGIRIARREGVSASLISQIKCGLHRSK